MQALDMLSSLASSGAIKQNRVKDIKTALNKLAQACQLPLDDLDLASLETSYPTILKDYFVALGSSVSPHTIRNSEQNLGQLYRAAHAASLLTSRVLPRRSRRNKHAVLQEMRDQSPYRAHRSGPAQGRYGIPIEQWPPAMMQGWQPYADIKALQVRQISLKQYTLIMCHYLGYNLSHDPQPPARWEQLFEIPRIVRCVSWLATRVGAERITCRGTQLVAVLVDIAKHLERPEYAALHKFNRQLPDYAKVYDKQAPRHTVRLIELDHVGVSLMSEARQPRRYVSSGIKLAVTFAAGLSIRLLVRCPRRGKEIREMDLGGRLYQDAQGTWQLYYKSHQLKIAEHDGRPNEFRMEWPPDLVSDLTEYLQVHRPRLLTHATSTLVFPTSHGTQLDRTAFWRRIAPPCWDRLNKHVFPHLFRTLWCDAYIDAHPGDFEGAAAMLNDTEATVRGWYRQFRVEQQLKKGTDFNAQLFGNGHRNR